jgi:ABC-type uncharacterized transport system ATPase subunit
MPLNKLLALEPNRTLSWLEAAEGRQFNELVEDWAATEYRKLRASTEDFEVFRAQGALKYLSQIVELPQEIRSYLHDVSTGKRKKIELKEI